MADAVEYRSIVLGGRGVSAPGTFKLHAGGVAWKKSHVRSLVSAYSS